MYLTCTVFIIIALYALSENFFVVGHQCHVQTKLITLHKLAMYFCEKTYHFSFVF